MREYGSQAVVWQTGVNPIVALELLDSGAWTGAGVLGPEAFDAVPFLDLLAGDYALPVGPARDGTGLRAASGNAMFFAVSAGRFRSGPPHLRQAVRRRWMSQTRAMTSSAAVAINPTAPAPL